MANMSYCRFENTLRDLKDCFDVVEQSSSAENFYASLSPSEARAAKEVFELCREIILNYDDILE